MEEKEISTRESVEIISSMIKGTRNRLELGDGNVMLMWGIVSVAVAALVWVLISVTHNVVFNWFWFLIWIIGGTVHGKMMKKKNAKSGVKTYTDKLCSDIWSIVGYFSLVSVAICLGMMLFAAKDVWVLMFIFALLVIGIIEMVQGLIIREKSFVVGGAIGALAGLIVVTAIISQAPLYYNYYIPLYIVAFIGMMIVPGIVLNKKAKKAA